LARSAPVCEELAWRRNHRRNQDEELDGNSRADERRREAAKRVPDDDDVPTFADCLDDHVDVFGPAGRLVLAGKIDGDWIVPVLTQLGRDQVPIPRAPAASVDGRERRH
jgi:hypothetical protein